MNAGAGRQPAGLPGLQCRRRRRLPRPRAARVEAAGLESAAAAALTDEAATAATSTFFRTIMGLGVAACFLGASARGVQVRAAATRVQVTACCHLVPACMLASHAAHRHIFSKHGRHLFRHLIGCFFLCSPLGARRRC